MFVNFQLTSDCLANMVLVYFIEFDCIEWKFVCEYIGMLTLKIVIFKCKSE